MGRNSIISLKKSKSLFLSSYILVLCLFLVVLTPFLSVISKFSFNAFFDIFTRKSSRKVIFNSVNLAFFTSIFSTTIGYMYAYGVFYSASKIKKILFFAPYLHLLLPPSVSVLSFILLFGKNGFITHIVFNSNFSPYGFLGLLMAQILSFFPISYIIFYNHFKSLNHMLELTSYNISKRFSQTFFLTIRLSSLAIIESVSFVFLLSLSDYGNPSVLCGSYNVLSTEIYKSIEGWNYNIARSASYSIVVILIAFVVIFFQNFFEYKLKDKTTKVGDNVQGNLVFIAPKRFQIFINIFCIAISLIIIAEVISIFIASFQKVYAVDYGNTFNHVRKISASFREIRNSLAFAFIASVFSTCFAFFSSYIVAKTDFRFSKGLNFICLLPSFVPGSIFGLGYLIVSRMLNFYNSKTLIILVMIIGFLPYAYKIFLSKMLHLGNTLDKVYISSGANWNKGMIDIIFPLLKRDAYASFFYTFVRGMGTLSAIVFLVSFDTPLSSIKIINLIDAGFIEEASCISSFLMLIVFLTFAFFYIVIRCLDKKNVRT